MNKSVLQITQFKCVLMSVNKFGIITFVLHVNAAHSLMETEQTVWVCCWSKNTWFGWKSASRQSLTH